MSGTHPGHDHLSSQVLHLGLDLAADVQLVAVQGDALQVGQQVLLAGGVGALRAREEREASVSQRGGSVRRLLEPRVNIYEPISHFITASWRRRHGRGTRPH